LFTWIGRKFAHRLPGTTKSDPSARGAYDSAAGARSAGITLDVLEALFYGAIVDGYMQEWDRLRGQRRIVLWEEAVAHYGVPEWLGSRDDLTLLLLRAHNPRNRPSGRYWVRMPATGSRSRAAGTSARACLTDCGGRRWTSTTTGGTSR